ncbi:MAG: EpsI family protein [Armatimonadetes bacterium]|nr:EpsI family protein [Armatimonadota bacterium]
MSGYTVRYLIACGLLVAAAAVQRLLGSQSDVPAVRPDWSQLPRRVGEWQDEDLPVDKATAEYLAADAILTRLYHSGDKTVKFSAVFGTQWRALHSPAGCFPSQGWQIVGRSHVQIPAPEDCPHPGPLNAEVFVAKQGKKYAVVTYLYAYPGGTTANWVEQCYRVTAAGARRGGIVFIAEAEAGLSEARQAQEAEAELIRGLYSDAVRVWYSRK